MLKVTSWLKCIHVYLCVIANNVILKHHCKCSHVFTKIINIIGKINSSMIQLNCSFPLENCRSLLAKSIQCLQSVFSRNHLHNTSYKFSAEHKPQCHVK